MTQFGREFKRDGYTLSDGQTGASPLAAFVQFSGTHTKADQLGGAAPHVGPNDNLALDQLSLFLAGRLSDWAGGFVQLTYDGVARQFHWDNLDLRAVTTASALGGQWHVGLTLNNSPTVQDLWNTTPVWGFPYAASPLAPTPAAATLIDGGLAQQVVGLGAYAALDDGLYLEATAYRELTAGARGVFGVTPTAGVTTLHGLAPYWRVVADHQFGNHYLAIGGFGLLADLYPNGDGSAGTDRIEDVGADLTWQVPAADGLGFDAYLTYVHEDQHLGASTRLVGARLNDRLDSFRANVTLDFRDTILAQGQYFRIDGTPDPALYASISARPDSAGWVGELDYIPTGKLDSSLPSWLNLKLSLQYVAYERFDGARAHAADNDTLYALIWLAVAL